VTVKEALPRGNGDNLAFRRSSLRKRTLHWSTVCAAWRDHLKTNVAMMLADWQTTSGFRLTRIPGTPANPRAPGGAAAVAG
jgi:hypothetical protein